MYQLWRLLAWLRDRITGTNDDADGPTDDGDADDSSGAAFSSLDASVNYAHGEPRNGVRELQRANEYANELEDVHRRDR